MSAPTWVEEYQDNDVWPMLESIVNIAEHYAPESPDLQYQLDHIRLVAKEVAAYKKASPLLITSDLMSALSSSVNSVKAPLDQWQEDGPATLISEAYAYLPGLQAAARQWPMAPGKSLQSAAAALREAVKASKENFEYLRRLLRETDEEFRGALQDHLETARTEFQGVLDQVNQAESSTTQKISQLQGEVARIETLISSIENRANQALESYQRQFQSAEQSRAKAHTELVNDHEQKLRATTANAQASLQKYREQEEQEFLVVKTRVDELKDDIEKTVGAVGTAATAEWYKTHANEQRGAADRWRLFALSLFVVAFLVVAYSVFINDTTLDSWKATILKSTATASLVAGAIYASKESGKHRDAEFKSKTTELTLRALDPFIATIDDEPRQRLRTEAARQVFFLNPSLEHTHDDEEDYVDGSQV